MKLAIASFLFTLTVFGPASPALAVEESPAATNETEERHLQVVDPITTSAGTNTFFADGTCTSGGSNFDGFVTKPLVFLDCVDNCNAFPEGLVGFSWSPFGENCVCSYTDGSTFPAQGETVNGWPVTFSQTANTAVGSPDGTSPNTDYQCWTFEALEAPVIERLPGTFTYFADGACQSSVGGNYDNFAVGNDLTISQCVTVCDSSPEGLVGVSYSDVGNDCNCAYTDGSTFPLLNSWVNGYTVTWSQTANTAVGPVDTTSANADYQCWTFEAVAAPPTIPDPIETLAGTYTYFADGRCSAGSFYDNFAMTVDLTLAECVNICNSSPEGLVGVSYNDVTTTAFSQSCICEYTDGSTFPQAGSVVNGYPVAWSQTANTAVGTPVTTNVDWPYQCLTFEAVPDTPGLQPYSVLFDTCVADFSDLTAIDEIQCTLSVSPPTAQYQTEYFLGDCSEGTKADASAILALGFTEVFNDQGDLGFSYDFLEQSPNGIYDFCLVFSAGTGTGVDFEAYAIHQQPVSFSFEGGSVSISLGDPIPVDPNSLAGSTGSAADLGGVVFTAQAFVCDSDGVATTAPASLGSVFRVCIQADQSGAVVASVDEIQFEQDGIPYPIVSGGATNDVTRTTALGLPLVIIETLLPVRLFTSTSPVTASGNVLVAGGRRRLGVSMDSLVRELENNANEAVVTLDVELDRTGVEADSSAPIAKSAFVIVMALVSAVLI